MIGLVGWHIGRSFAGTRLEDACPCGQAACGLVDDPDPTCDQHAMWAARTIRQAHVSIDCPGARPDAPLERAAESAKTPA